MAVASPGRLAASRARRPRRPAHAAVVPVMPAVREPRIDVAPLCVAPDAPIRDVISCIDRNAEGIALVVDGDRRLLGTVTDGDVRRGVLAGVRLDWPVDRLVQLRTPTAHPSPLTAPAGTADAELLDLMRAYDLRHIPLVDADGTVVDLALLSHLVKELDPPVEAVVMAGGLGTRLRPLTENVPKPMLPVGGRPLLELTVERLRKSGVKRVALTTHYKGEVIANHFGDGRAFGVDIRYVEEHQPLGTAGALRLFDVAEADDPLLVINGDILTDVDFRAMVRFHREQGADLTVAVRQYDFQVPYGVVECQGTAVTRLVEKPRLDFFVNAGMYLVSPAALRLVPGGQAFHMTDLIQRLIADGRPVVSFPVWEYWLDIGQHADYERAQVDVREGRAAG